MIENRKGDEISCSVLTVSARSERLFQHLPDCRPALAEVIRVTRPAGWVVALDTDWNTLSIDTHLTDVERRLKQHHVAHGTHNGWRYDALYQQYVSYMHDKQLRESHGPYWWHEYTHRSAYDPDARSAKVAERELRENLFQLH